MEARRRYKNQTTDSTAVLTVCQVIRDVLNSKESSNDTEGFSLNKLKWPIQILELLICNNENALLSLKQTSLIYCINEIFATLGSLDATLSNDAAVIIKIAARILATVMNHVEAKT
jgi:hypothetical protein